MLQGAPDKNIWYKYPIPEGITGDGSEYYIYIKRAQSDNLCVFLSGGGVAGNRRLRGRSQGERWLAGLPNYYWNNLRPFTQIMNINIGIKQRLGTQRILLTTGILLSSRMPPGTFI